ncbi:hypothetical protein QAD02_022622 [Eretmocerus hayati]|uniref:Uncharacterized protein n=1 Tax=Eretmocerus hayati TaxID=131215 RepID=A0ACC2PTM9_9HYME|nr:hypothetical protein QAD02_022622 [Eretmocerus hayati]
MNESGIDQPNQPMVHGYQPIWIESAGQIQNTSKHICSRCGRMYNCQGNLSRHKRYECGVEAPRYYCLNCPKRCKRKENMKDHIKRLHKNESVFAYRVVEYFQCPQIFSTPSVATWEDLDQIFLQLYFGRDFVSAKNLTHASTVKTPKRRGRPPKQVSQLNQNPDNGNETHSASASNGETLLSTGTNDKKGKHLTKSGKKRRRRKKLVYTILKRRGGKVIRNLPSNNILNHIVENSVQQVSQENSNGSTPNPPIQKRRGRPPSKKPSEDQTVKRIPVRPLSQSLIDSNVKRRRGRPPTKHSNDRIVNPSSSNASHSLMNNESANYSAAISPFDLYQYLATTYRLFKPPTGLENNFVIEQAGRHFINPNICFDTEHHSARPSVELLPNSTGSGRPSTNPNMSPTAKRRPGRPPTKLSPTLAVKRRPKKPVVKPSIEPHVKRLPGRQPSQLTNNLEVKRRPGRPPTKPTVDQVIERRPGRPPTKPSPDSFVKESPQTPSIRPTTVVTAEHEPGESPSGESHLDPKVKRRPGRPPTKISTDAVVKRRRGRLPSNLNVEPVTKRRRGRKPSNIAKLPAKRKPRRPAIEILSEPFVSVIRLQIKPKLEESIPDQTLADTESNHNLTEPSKTRSISLNMEPNLLGFTSDSQVVLENSNIVSNSTSVENINATEDLETTATSVTSHENELLNHTTNDLSTGSVDSTAAQSEEKISADENTNFVDELKQEEACTNMMEEIISKQLPEKPMCKIENVGSESDIINSRDGNINNTCNGSDLDPLSSENCETES